MPNIKNYHQASLWCKPHHNAKVFFLAFFLIFSFCVQKVSGQQSIAVKAKNTTLNKALTLLRDSYDIKLSFNDDKLAKYTVNVDKKFTNPTDALTFLLKKLPLKLETINNVFLIVDLPKPLNTQKHLLSGYIIDKNSQESLPFSCISINNNTLISDAKGNFSYTSTTDTVFKLQVSYLGYFDLDTLVNATNNLPIRLLQNSITIGEVIIKSSSLGNNYNNASVKLNHNVGQNLPGSSDNAVFNLLRLQPGILAAGEQASDLIIWGSYKGQTKVAFDGFTIFGLKNFNDNIGAVNPLMAKDLDIKKGGYGVENGDRVGGIITITGIDGDLNKPNLKLTANNLTLNGLVSTPVFKNTALVIAGRQTYYNLYNAVNVKSQQITRNGLNNLVDIAVQPDYVFGDFNLKFTGKTNFGDNYYLSLFRGSDKFTSDYNTAQGRLNIAGTNTEKNTQFGAAAFYGKTWHNGGISNITLAAASLVNNNDKNVNITLGNNNRFFNRISALEQNEITENSLKITHKLPSTKNNSILLGGGFINNQTSFTKDSVTVREIEVNNLSNRLYAFTENSYLLSPKIKIIPGIRSDLDLADKKFYIQPRLAINYQLVNDIKLLASWGLYNQFIAYTAVQNAQGDFNYQWTVSDNKKIPVYAAQHWVFGAVYQKNNFVLSTNVFVKYTDGITRFVQNQTLRSTLIGNGRSKGFDVLIKKEYKGNMAWVAYSLSKTEEAFPTILKSKPDNTYRRAPQDQTHELKFASVLKLYRFYLATNYVYGSGFPSLNPKLNQDVNQLAYHRFDTAITYKFTKRKYHLETGISILNLFDTQNLKTDNLQRIPTEQLSTLNIYSQAVPFTPTVFFNFSI